MDLPHLFVEQFTQAQSYSGSGRGNFLKYPRTKAERASHGSFLEEQLSAINFDHPVDYISLDEPGIYVEVVSCPNFELAIESLDTAQTRLCSVKENEDGSQSALVFIFDSGRSSFLRKVSRYQAQEQGSQTHSKLFDNIASIRLANLKSLWTSVPAQFPVDPSSTVWWEIWLLRKSENREEIAQFRSYCKTADLVISPGEQKFEQYSVLAVCASTEQLEQALVLISCLAELRNLVDTSHFLLDLSPREQADWSSEILDRTVFTTDLNTRVLILDTGVNFNHILLNGSTSPNWSNSWNDNWSDYDTQYGHGTMQAGLILYGDILQQIASSDAIHIEYKIESCRVLPPNDANDRSLFGAAMYFGVTSAEAANGEANRVISLAVTADSEGISGQPSSWSSEIDQLSYSGSSRRLFITSAGNIRGADVVRDYRNNVLRYPIEDPSQSWNAITVGAYTEKEDVVEQDFRGWEPLARNGDISPTSRTSHSWAWKKEAPFKPDIVEEGGNLLIQPASGEITNADCVSLVTTAEPSHGVLFTDHRDTSASNALCARLAAKLWSQYPSYRAETIRGLIVHSAQWNAVMSSFIEEALTSGYSPIEAKEIVLRVFGYGIPSEEAAIFSSQQRATLVVEENLMPYVPRDGDLAMNEMHIIELPWPTEVLHELGSTNVSLKTTLSYFVEPNPGRRNYVSRFRYQSFGLRFKLLLPSEDVDEFRSRISVPDRDESYVAPSDDDGQGWVLGSNLRTRGSLHQDTWHGTASELAARDHIAVYPVAGWWKQRQNKLFSNKAEINVPYSLIVTLQVEDPHVEIYDQISDIIETRISLRTEVGVEL